MDPPLSMDLPDPGAVELRTEGSIRASEVTYRRLFEAARDGILILDVETGCITDVNPFLVELLAFSRDEMIGKTVGELSPFKDIESNKEMLERLQRDRYVRYEDLPLETKDGRHMEVEFVCNVYQAGAREVIQCNIRDITERKRSEAMMNRLASIVESSDDAIIGKDLNSVITNWNRGAEKMFGYAAGEIVGSSIMRLIPADLQAEELQIIAKVQGGESGEIFDTLRQTKDGRLIHVSITLSPIKDARGIVTGVSKVAHDITARNAAEVEIRLLNTDLDRRVAERTAELQLANEELEAFSYSVSHDLRAPLRQVMGFVKLLQMDAGLSLPEKSQRYLTIVSESAHRMGSLIDELLAFSRVGRTALRITEVNLGELVRETLGELQVETADRKIVWTIESLPTVMADRSLLGLVLTNLIGNAVKFTGARPEAIIEIGSVPGRESETVIFIRDNGAGFDPKYIGKLFGVFQRLHSEAEFAGTGIGLANVQRIIHRHGGRVWAEGRVNGGATFFFSIPTPIAHEN